MVPVEVAMKKKRSLTFKGEFVDTLDWEKAEVFYHDGRWFFKRPQDLTMFLMRWS